MNVFEYSDYKSLLRARVKEVQTEKKSFTLKKLAGLLEIQNTYLSKVLNDEKAHLSEDHLYQSCKWLGLKAPETDYVLLLRTRSATSDPDRREFLSNKIDRLKTEQRLSAEIMEHAPDAMQTEMRYLLDPMAILIHAALRIPEYRDSPTQLCGPLGISITKLKDILKTLSRLDLIELEEKSLRVRAVLRHQIHYGRDHPLMRTHQSLLKTLVHSQVNKTAEEDKLSFLVTFASDEESFEKAKLEWQKFIKSIELLVGKSKPKAVYQLNFDLFRWV